MREQKYIECPECKSVIREDVKTCPHCRTKVNNKFRGAMSDKTGTGLFFLIFIVVLILSSWLTSYIETIFHIRFGDSTVPYFFGFAFLVALLSNIVIEVRAKRKHDKENQKVYVDPPSSL